MEETLAKKTKERNEYRLGECFGEYFEVVNSIKTSKNKLQLQKLQVIMLPNMSQK